MIKEDGCKPEPVKEDVDESEPADIGGRLGIEGMLGNEDKDFDIWPPNINERSQFSKSSLENIEPYFRLSLKTGFILPQNGVSEG